jgi:3-oxoacyl-[acyl-carrier protein] reductase
MSKLQGKVAIVTGASKGIGAGIAKALAAEGASVVVNYASSRAGADKVVADIAAKGGKAIAVAGDVSKEADVKSLFAAAHKAYGRLDVLVNNAGVYEFAPLEEISETSFHRHFNINVLGPLLATREALKYFPKAGGSVINVSSIAAFSPTPTASVYSATKGALDTISLVLAHELGARNIRVNSLNPGLVETEGVHTLGALGSDFEKQILARTPLRRVGQPDDIGKVAVFLASDESGWVTGERIAAGGGYA